jgi:hypothetical protein
MKFLIMLMLLTSQVFAVECGDTLTENTKLTQDLDCSNYSGFAALTLRGNTILQGNNHRIISPNTTVGIYAEGGDIRVRRTTIETNADAIGIMAYNVQKMIVNKSNISNSYIGVDYYTDDTFACDRLRISNSTLTNNQYAAKVIAPNCDYVPRFVNNDFSNSRQYALNISSQKIRLLEKQQNIFTGSENGLLLQASDKIKLVGLNLQNDGIIGTSIFIYSTDKVRAKNLVLGNAQEGLHIYDAKDVVIKNTQVDNADVGLKVVNESVDTTVTIKKSDVTNSNIALIIEGFGSGQFTSVTKQNNILDGYVVENY